MEKTTEQLLVAGGVVGAVGILAAIVFWPKKASASTSPPKASGPITYIPTYSSAVLPYKVGDSQDFVLGDLTGTGFKWHVDGPPDLVQGVAELGANPETDGNFTFKFVKAGAGSFKINKVYANGTPADPGMVVNVSVT